MTAPEALSSPRSASSVEERARLSLGTSASAIYEMVERIVKSLQPNGLLADVGCGTGNLYPFVRRFTTRYIGIDILRYDEFPDGAEFRAVNLDTGRLPLEDGTVDVAVAVETIEHLENPRAFVRELTRVVRPGGWVVLTTPNQRSLLSLMTLLHRGHYAAFQSSDYPAHLTALLEMDLLRIGAECGLTEARFEYSRSGRIVWTAAHFPRLLSDAAPRLLSDNLCYLGRKPLV